MIRGQPKNAPPPEKTIGLSNVVAPKLGRGGKDRAEVKDSVSYECSFVCSKTFANFINVSDGMI